jgi:hypothetical protein
LKVSDDATVETEGTPLRDMMLLVLRNFCEFHLHSFSRSFLPLSLKNVIFFAPFCTHDAFVSGCGRALGFETSENENCGRLSPATQYIGTP